MAWLMFINQPGTGFPTSLHLCPAKSQISLHINVVWSESLQSTLWVEKDSIHCQVDNEDDNQLGHTCNLVGNAVPLLKCERKYFKE